VGAMVGFQFHGAALPVGHQGVVAELGEAGQLALRVGRTRRTMSRTFIPFLPKAV
jgi:hypothetical protein